MLYTCTLYTSCIVTVVVLGEQIKGPMGSVDYLNEYEKILHRRFSATGRSILDFNGEH